MNRNLMTRWFVIGVTAALLSTSLSLAAQPAAKKKAAAPSGPKPTLADVAYGDHPKQVLDFWKAESDRPDPARVRHPRRRMDGGEQERWSVDAGQDMLEAGISVVAIKYRFVSRSHRPTASKPPVKWPLHDAARALQFVRSKAGEWNLDKTRIGAAGGSAGACSSLWLAFHDDLADPESDDPVARESTRLWCAAVDRRTDHARPAADEGVDAEQPVRRPRLRVQGDRKEKKPSQFAAVSRRPREDPALDRGVFALRAGHGRRSAGLPHLLRARPPSARSRRTRPTPPTSA